MTKQCLIFVMFICSGICCAEPIQQLVQRFSHREYIGLPVTAYQLKPPYDYLLTQTLMTKAIETYYKRISMIQPIFKQPNQQKGTYYRVILMYLDQNQARNNPKIALEKKEAWIAELAFININFEALPRKLQAEVKNSNIPFGKLLMNYNIAVENKDRRYFTLLCDASLAAIMHCKLDEMLYGRTNRLINKNNRKWLARVVEILSSPSSLR